MYTETLDKETAQSILGKEYKKDTEYRLISTPDKFVINVKDADGNESEIVLDDSSVLNAEEPSSILFRSDTPMRYIWVSEITTIVTITFLLALVWMIIKFL